MPEDRDTRERLYAERAGYVDRISDAERERTALHAAAQDSNSDDEHDPDGATIAFERAQLQHSAQRAIEQLAAVEEALERLSAGSYGRCVECGGVIAAARLEALPSTPRCLRCASR